MTEEGATHLNDCTQTARDLPERSHSSHLPSFSDGLTGMAYSLTYNTAYEGDSERLGYNSSERWKRRGEQQREGTWRTDEDTDIGKATPAMA